MAYSKTTYVNGESPYINAGNLNKSENQHEFIDKAVGTDSINTYSNSSTYSAGDYCIYNNILYQANQTIGTAEEFNSSHWNAVNILVKLSDIVPLGVCFKFFGTPAPEKYMFADGSAISRTTYSELFELIGTTYGSGDGSTTFNLPNEGSNYVIKVK